MKKNNVSTLSGEGENRRTFRSKSSEDCLKFRTRCVLVFWFAITACSGFGLHWAGHHPAHEVWHDWAVFHVLSSVIFMATGFRHASLHRRWYKAWTKGAGHKSMTTLWLSVSFVLSSASGVYLVCCVEGDGSAMGKLHYAVGILMTVAGIGHIGQRWRVMWRYLKKTS